jgi:hypothetical protein
MKEDIFIVVHKSKAYFPKIDPMLAKEAISCFWGKLWCL